GGGGEFTSAHDPHPEPLSFRLRLGHARQRVVIGQGDGTQAKLGGTADHGGRSEQAVGRGGMEVQVDQGGNRRAQRPYPSSGEVQDGCDTRHSAISSASLSSASEASRFLAESGEYLATRSSGAAGGRRLNRTANSSLSYWVIRPAGETAQRSPSTSICRPM